MSIYSSEFSSKMSIAEAEHARSGLKALISSNAYMRLSDEERYSLCLLSTELTDFQNIE